MCVPVCVHVCIYVFYVNLQANSQIYIKMQRAKNSQDILGKELKEREKKKNQDVGERRGGGILHYQTSRFRTYKAT